MLRRIGFLMAFLALIGFCTFFSISVEAHNAQGRLREVLDTTQSEGVVTYTILTKQHEALRIQDIGNDNVVDAVFSPGYDIHGYPVWIKWDSTIQQRGGYGSQWSNAKPQDLLDETIALQ